MFYLIPMTGAGALAVVAVVLSLLNAPLWARAGAAAGALAVFMPWWCWVGVAALMAAAFIEGRRGV